MNKIVLLLFFFRTFLNSLTLNNPVRYAKFTRAYITREYVLTMVSSSAVVPRSGLYYFSQGWKLITQPGIRRFVILPLLVNILLMGGAFWWLFTQLDSWIPR